MTDLSSLSDDALMQLYQGAGAAALPMPISPAATNAYGDAIAALESRGSGDYRALGPTTRTGDRAFGRYQVMGANVGPWTKEILGREMKPHEFLMDPQAQDAVFQGKFNSYVSKYGPEGAARAWFAGEGGMNDPNRRDILGTRVADYGARFSRELGRHRPSPGGTFGPAPDSAPTPTEFSAQSRMPAQRPISAWSNDELLAAYGQPAAAQPSSLANMATSLTGASAPVVPTESSLLIDLLNQGSAAGQGTTAMTAAHAKNLISSDVYQSDTGEMLFKDKQGNIQPTDQNKQVVLRDPADNRLKVYERTAVTEAGPLESAGRLAMTGLATGAPTARPAIASALSVPKAPSAAALKEFSQAAYKSPAVVDFRVSPIVAEEFSTAAQKAIGPSKEVAPETYNLLNRFGEGKEGYLRTPDGLVSGDNLNDFRYLLGEKAAMGGKEGAAATQAIDLLDQFIPKLANRPEVGKFTSQQLQNLIDVSRNQSAQMRAAANDMRFPADVRAHYAAQADGLDNAIARYQQQGGQVVISGDPAAAAAALTQARGDWAAMAGSSALDKRIARAEIRAASANSGANLQNQLRSKAGSFLESPESRGLTVEERTAIRQFVDGTLPQNAMRAMGNKLSNMFTGGAMGTIGAIAGGTAGSAAVLGLGTLAAGSALKKLSNVLTARQADQLSNLIRSRAPSAQGAKNALEAWNKYAEMAARNPTSPRAMAMINLTSRNLANNLQSLGITVSPADLVRSLQGPVRGAAQDEQQ